MTQQQQFLEALSEALSMALRALTTNVSKEEAELTKAFITLRLGQINREIERGTK